MKRIDKVEPNIKGRCEGQPEKIENEGYLELMESVQVIRGGRGGNQKGGNGKERKRSECE